MAYEIPGFTFTLEAANDLSAKQFYFVELDAQGKCDVCDALTDVAIGVLQNAPVAGESATIMQSGITKVSSDEALSVGDQVGPSADGQADVRVIGTDVTHYVNGIVLEATGTADGIGTILLGVPHRAV